MGKGTDKLYITHSEWSSSDAYSASTGSSAGAKSRSGTSSSTFRRLPFNFCAASLQPFKNPVCTPDGTIFDVEVIGAWLEKRGTNPVTGEPLKKKDLIKLNFTRNADVDSRGAGLSDGLGDLVDPVTYKVFTDNTHIVAIRHGSYANVFAWDTVERMNIKAKMWRDLLDDEPFTRADIITLQDPQFTHSRDLSKFKHLSDGGEAILTKEQEEERKSGGVNVDALGRIGDKVLRAKAAVEKARKEREAGKDVNKSTALTKSPGTSRQSTTTAASGAKVIPAKAAIYTTGKAAASFTSTGLTPETSGARAILTDEEFMLKPRRVKIKGYARIETNLGDINVELHTDTAPKAVWNFVRLAQKGYYNGVAFHRNIPNFMIQGGDPTGTGRGGSSIWEKNFDDEFDGPYTHSARGILSMANKGKNTNSSQFFITYKPTPHLDRKHTVFGRVVDGMDVLSKMEDVPTDGSNRPLNKIVMKNVVVYLDPFEEFLKQRGEQEKLEQKKEAIRRSGGTEDDRTTWTGKRLRGAGSQGAGDSAPDVGKYLKASTGGSAAQDSLEVEEEIDAWDAPAKKKVKAGGFGNFDNW
ncbi:Peptidyl-prolyl cis-trans isomerase-like 2 [Scedosporium apiospermum]|uniref:Peptidyl-prolyl cis-trans isomerase-like 2 n=1 Tax=Pseudallescheria apiosperma TaxID=563466 RepID=A0A084G5M4_PSEDA|nr:Peptidyl-prolyl cis-trans isomerase-like 2 [Scedosporium apiospermum]KEZ42636.1 Peptidyl-prolyl cis-trans isomerase-like 2 [Scedosporium apiospermum]